ncbi:hypothetical protein Q7P37_008215 [Cladosporium fusiforme]
MDPVADLFVDLVTYSEPDGERHRELHQRDEASRWFQVVQRDFGTEPAAYIQVTDRFRQLCNPGMLNHESVSPQYPGFVSFIGETSAGKSTLIKAMLLMGHLYFTGDEFEPTNKEGKTATDDVELRRRVEQLERDASSSGRFPVTRSSNIENIIDPTSLGVNLYKDVPPPHVPGASEMPQTPIMFADCEGLNAGMAITSSERSRSPSKAHSSRGAVSYQHHAHENSTRASLSPYPLSQTTQSQPITQTTQVPPYDAHVNHNLIFEEPITNTKKPGKEGIEMFYARMLYTISDVFVYVTSSDQSLYNQMQRLLEWASDAVNQAFGAPSHKTLIIVRHMTRLHNSAFYDTEQLRRSFLDRLSPLWRGSPQLEKFIDAYNERPSLRNDQKILDNDALFREFFKTIHVLYVPDRERAPTEELFRQYRALRAQIFDASQQAQLGRAQAWMQWNVPTLSHILTRAFDHFRTSTEALNFYDVLRNDNPTPTTMSDHIANFLRLVHELPDLALDMAKDLVAAGCLTWAQRELAQVYEPQEIFENDLQESCKKGIDTYAKKYQRCNFSFGLTGKCMLHRAQHEQEHRDSKGGRKPGSFEDSGSRLQLIMDPVHRKFINLYNSACSIESTHPTLDTKQYKRREIYREHQKYLKDLRSNKTCITCLQAVPDHVLECGHAFCDTCVREFGSLSEDFEAAWVIKTCMLCWKQWYQGGHVVRFKPKCAGVRVLSLDGGGIRGIVELVLLELVHQRMGIDSLAIKDCFDLITGTSTGGLIALGLAVPNGSRELTISDMKTRFLDMARKAFQNQRQSMMDWDLPTLITNTLVLFGLSRSIYPTTPLRQCLQELFGSDTPLFGPLASTSRRDTRVAVTSVKSDGEQLCLITNYNRQNMAEDEWGGIQREDQGANELRVWEAGLATAAAPLYFKAFFKPETKKYYLDGGLKANFPGEKALAEMSTIWTVKTKLEVVKPHLDLMVTVGTGVQQQDLHIPFAAGGINKMVKIFSENLDSDHMWQEFRKKQDEKHASRTVRLNTSLPTAKYIAFFDYRLMDSIADHVSAEGTSDPQLKDLITSVASRLLASLFFFQPHDLAEPISRSGQGAAACSGYIRCRLAKGSPELTALVSKVTAFWLKTSSKSEDQDARYVDSADPMFKEAGMSATEPWKTTWTEVPFVNERRMRSQIWGERRCSSSTLHSRRPTPGILDTSRITLRESHMSGKRLRLRRLSLKPDDSALVSYKSSLAWPRNRAVSFLSVVMKRFRHYIHDLSGVGKRAQDAIRSTVHSSAALFVPSQWTHNIIHGFLNARETTQRELLTSVFVETTLSIMNFTSVTSALLAAVISGAFSWYNVEQTHWCTKACWYSGLVFSLASISAAGLCSGSLLRLKCHSDSTSRVRTVVGYPSRSSHEWTPRMLQPWIWGLPGMLLKLSVLWFLVGLALEIWLAARRAHFNWDDDDVKIAAFVTLTALFAAFSYAVAVVGLFFPTLSHDESRPQGV